VSDGKAENPYASPQPVQNLDWQFSVASLFLLTTLVAVCLGVWLISPGLGALLTFFAVPALVRTAIDSAQHKRAGAPLRGATKLASFAVSLAAVLAATFAACIAAAIALVASCFAVIAVEPIGARSDTMMMGFLIGTAIMALGAYGGVLWLTRPRRD
jgi:hypothetical protein